MHNLKDIRKDFEGFKKSLEKRNVNVDFEKLKKLDIKNRELIQIKEGYEKEKKDISKSKDESLFKKSKEISNKLNLIITEQNQIQSQLNGILSNLPNIPHDDVPLGNNENDNVEKSLLNRDTNFNYQKLEESFFEIAPLISNLEFDKQKDISSKPIDKFELPNKVFMIVDNKIELEPKLLKEYSEWEFLPKEDLERKTLEIFSDQRIAKSKCNKNQKLIKIPNSKVFLIASKFLKSRGISRIIFYDNLLSL